MSIFLVRQKLIRFLTIYITHIYIYVYKSFPTTLGKGLRNNIPKKRGDGEIGEHKLNEMGALNMK